MLRRSIVLVAVMTLLVVFAVPAAADAPVTFEDELYEWENAIHPLSGFCGFDIHETGYERVVVKGYTDSDGGEDRLQIHVRGQNKMWTDAGVTAFDRYAFLVVVDPVAQTETYKGNDWNLHAPGTGSGISVNDSGVLSFTWDGEVVKLAGPRDTFAESWPQDFCDALTP